jgi:hypothetical protein
MPTDHFADVSKMVWDIFSGIVPCFFGFFYSIQEIMPLGISQQ